MPTLSDLGYRSMYPFRSTGDRQTVSGYTQTPTNYARPIATAAAPTSATRGTRPTAAVAPAAAVSRPATQADSVSAMTLPGGRTVGGAATASPGGRALGAGQTGPGFIAGGPGENWNPETKSTPFMDWASGNPIHYIDELTQKYAATPSEVAAYQAEGLPPSWYLKGATSYEQVIANQKHQAATGDPLPPEQLMMYSRPSNSMIYDPTLGASVPYAQFQGDIYAEDTSRSQPMHYDAASGQLVPGAIYMKR